MFYFTKAKVCNKLKHYKNIIYVRKEYERFFFLGRI